MAPNKSHNHRKKPKKERLRKDAHVAIVGGGLGGLGAAICLQQAGFSNVSVWERDDCDSLRKGYGMTLSYNQKGPLAHMGILEDVASRDCPSRSHYVFDTDGNIMGYYGNAFVLSRGHGQRGNLRVPRSVLLDLLRRRVQETDTAIHYNKRLVSLSLKTEEKPRLTLKFCDGSKADDVDLLVAADGIRSSVVETLLKNDHTSDLQYMGVFLILGIADQFVHPLTDERGFYTLDGAHRLFTMPYEGNRLDPSEERRIMWQLSFRLEDFDEANQLAGAGSEALLAEVLRRCTAWHAPVLGMVRASPVHTIWGTPLLDRDPYTLINHLDPVLSRRVVVLGDAAHPMSCFKGQGANQALIDGPLLASWLARATVDSAVKGFMREMAQRTSRKVSASREAARRLHSSAATEETYEFAGVRSDAVPELLRVLRERQISAGIESDLDSNVRQVIDELDLGTKESSVEPMPSQAEERRREALALAASGNTHGLRSLSLAQSSLLAMARDEGGGSCLHAAVSGGHYETCRWLLSEVFGSADDLVNDDNHTPLDIATRMGNPQLVALLSS